MSKQQAFYTPAEAANFLRFSPTTLAIWRTNAQGPAYMKIGNSIRYRLVDLEMWVEAPPTERADIERSAPCHQQKRASTKRLRGRAGAIQRKLRLAAEPLCRDCLERGIQRRSEEVHHIKPLADGGPDTDDNICCLCPPCHAARTSEEMRNGSSN